MGPHYKEYCAAVCSCSKSSLFVLPESFFVVLRLSLDLGCDICAIVPDVSHFCLTYFYGSSLRLRFSFVSSAGLKYGTLGHFVEFELHVLVGCGSLTLMKAVKLQISDRCLIQPEQWVFCPGMGSESKIRVRYLSGLTR